MLGSTRKYSLPFHFPTSPLQNVLFVALIAGFFRLLPEIISWPYTVGFDPMNYYVIALLQGPAVTNSQLMHYAPMYWLLQDALYRKVFGNPLLVVNVIAPILQASLAASIFGYCFRVLKWAVGWSTSGALLSTIYFVSLRIAWEEYRVMLGIIFLFITLILLSDTRLKFQYAGIVGAASTAFSHELVSWILVLILVVRIGMASTSGKLTKRMVPALASLSACTLIFVANVETNYASLTRTTSYASLTPTDALGLSSLTLLGFSLWAFLPLLPLLLAAWKIRSSIGPDMIAWIALGSLSVSFLVVSLPNMQVMQYVALRFVFCLTYPLALLATLGFRRIIATSDAGSSSGTLKAIGIGTVLLVLVLSATYVGTFPENANPYFSTYNPYLAYVPSSMLQNSISLHDMNSLVTVVSWVHNRLSIDQTLIFHEAFAGAVALSFGFPFPTNVQMIALQEVSAHGESMMVEQMISSSKIALQHGSVQVFTIWWVPGNGWYDIPSLPANFNEVYVSGNMAVYAYS